MMRAVPLPLPRRRSFVAVVGCAAVAGVAAYVWAHAIQSLAHPKAVPVHARPEAVVWGGVVFRDRLELQRWLRARGLSYAAWAKRHPDALQIVDPQAPSRKASGNKRPAAATAQRAKPKSVPAATAKRRAPVRVAAPRLPSVPHAEITRGSNVSATLLAVALATLEALLLAVAVFPARRGPVLLRRFYLVPERRLGAFAGALTIFFGFLVSFYLR